MPVLLHCAEFPLYINFKTFILQRCQCRGSIRAEEPHSCFTSGGGHYHKFLVHLELNKGKLPQQRRLLALYPTSVVFVEKENPKYNISPDD